jgi:cytochrome c oxidase subunit 2
VAIVSLSISSSILNPSSPEAKALFSLTLWVTALCLGVFILVVSLIVTICIKFSARKNPGEPKPVYGNVKLELLWTGIPLLLLTVVMIFTIKTMIETSPSETNTKPDLVVIGHQWWWEVRYPNGNGSEAITANEIHIPVGKRMLLEIQSSDVVHDFWVPELGRKIDAVPGHPNQIWLEADHAGSYGGFCAEFCGSSHAWMKILILAQNDLDYQIWLKKIASPALIPQSLSEKHGLTLFNEKTCTSCHHVEGISAPVQIGPDLTHLASRETLGAGVMSNNVSNVSTWIKDPGKIKPGAHMPSYPFTKTELADLTAYLESLQ